MNPKTYLVAIEGDTLQVSNVRRTSLLRGVGSALDIFGTGSLRGAMRRLSLGSDIKSDSQRLLEDLKRIKGDVDRAKHRLDADIARARG